MCKQITSFSDPVIELFIAVALALLLFNSYIRCLSLLAESALYDFWVPIAMRHCRGSRLGSLYGTTALQTDVQSSLNILRP